MTCVVGRGDGAQMFETQAMAGQIVVGTLMFHIALALRLRLAAKALTFFVSISRLSRPCGWPRCLAFRHVSAKPLTSSHAMAKPFQVGPPEDPH